jgi:adenylate cyclase class 2
MRAEIEIKLLVHDAHVLRRCLATLGFRRTRKRTLERNVLYDFPDRRLRAEGMLLRLRFERNRSVLTFKGKVAQHGLFKERPEIESRVSNGLEVGRILEAAGLDPAFGYEKYRTVYRRPGDPVHAEIAFDETPIGTYLEIEGPKRWIDRVAKGLGYRPRDYITASYGRLYLSWCEARGIEPGSMVFRDGTSGRKNGR